MICTENIPNKDNIYISIIIMNSTPYNQQSTLTQPAIEMKKTKQTYQNTYQHPKSVTLKCRII
ncbi:hypothetical protein Pint_21056 [Pistacia integerrima]|uniref:Uncharacterized protein n=1 Tax=Pistacia integerrima TaxID=434235 RepID=A0ACC0XBX0_9ROSI|nr:hypothetical protein Pint_21056 [Pistacia integerrima]